MSPESYLIQTSTSNWLRVPKWFQKGTCFIDLPNDLALNIDALHGKVELHAKDKEGIYRQIGLIHIDKEAIQSKGVETIFGHDRKILDFTRKLRTV